ncbi:MAG TPA: ATP-binding cassette domain-containing protein [Anseongella sp.]|nr:ATP-binding cassette domain-containing protein [Anseongella sp.]
MIPFLTLDKINVAYSGNRALSDISLRIHEGEHWAVTGGSGSGKTTLLEAIAGKHHLTAGSIRHHYAGSAFKKPLALVSHQHHFRNRYNLDDFYYQQRFNSADADEAVPVRDYLQENSPDGQTAAGIIGQLHLEGLLEKSLIKLSNGETRRLMFAAALLQKPRLLLLDAPFTGLDVSARPYFQELIGRMIASGLTVIMAVSENEIPPGITHVARLEGGRLTGTWERADFPAPAEDFYRPGSLAPDEKVLSRLLLPPDPAPFRHAVLMRNVSVSYGDTAVLKNINWEVKRGERWVLSGPNGAGKSTLLSLINADNPQAYANEIFLFDRKRGSGESIWEIKKKTGFVSPELHQYFRTADTCLQVVLSGLFDTMGLIRRCSSAQEEQAAAWLKLLGIEDLGGNLFRRSSLSTQRLVLLARALIKRPPLLILDEPCQGMDREQVQRIRLLIDSVCRTAGTTLIYVSHYQEEIPSCVNRSLRLEQGKVLSAGQGDQGPAL